MGGGDASVPSALSGRHRMLAAAAGTRGPRASEAPGAGEPRVHCYSAGPVDGLNANHRRLWEREGVMQLLERRY